MIGLADVFDFHTDIRFLVIPEDSPHDRIPEQLSLDACRQMAGVFSATGRLLNADRETQWRKLEQEIGALCAIDGLHLVRSVDDLDRPGGQVLHAEGIYFIENERQLGDLETLWERGFRSLGPMYNEDNALGGGARGDRARGLTPLGRELFRRAWELGFIVDAAHCNRRTLTDVLQLAEECGRPLHFTHGHLDDPVLPVFGERGLPRELVPRLLQTGGLIGLSPHPGFLGRWQRYLDEIAFVAEQAADRIVLGSDFTGIITPPETFPEYPSGDETPRFAERLAERHGESFARDYCGRTLIAWLRQHLPEA